MISSHDWEKNPNISFSSPNDSTSTLVSPKKILSDFLLQNSLRHIVKKRIFMLKNIKLVSCKSDKI